MNAPQQALIVRDDKTLKVSFTPSAFELRTAAMSKSALVGKVTNPAENEIAVAAQRELLRVQKLCEAARKEAKEPVLQFGRRIDETAKAFCDELNLELGRIAKLIGDFQQIEQLKSREAEKINNARLLEIEREKSAALANVKTHEEADAVTEHYNRKAEMMAPPPEGPARAPGQSVKPDWEITVINAYDLAKYHPHCVNITPKISEIKALLNQGVTIKGITAKPITKASVRLAPERKPIEV